MGSGHLLHVVLLTVSLFAVFRLNECSPSFNFQKARWVDLAFYFDSAEEYSSLFFATALFCFMTLNATKFFIPFGRVKRQPQAGWSAEVEGAASKRRKVFAVGHGGDGDRQAYISAYRHASSVIAKVEAWQVTCSSLFAKFNPKSVYSPLRSVAGSSPHLPSFLTFPTAPFPRSRHRSSPTTWDAIFFSPSQRPCVAEPEATFPSSAKPRIVKSLIRPSPPLNFSRLPQISPRPPPLA